MKVIPFSHTWPYERQMGEIYFSSCPYCSAENVLTHMSEGKLKLVREKIKQRLNMPCCGKTMTILEADEDYFWTDEKLR